MLVQVDSEHNLLNTCRIIQNTLEPLSPVHDIAQQEVVGQSVCFVHCFCLQLSFSFCSCSNRLLPVSRQEQDTRYSKTTPSFTLNRFRVQVPVHTLITLLDPCLRCTRTSS